MQTSLPTRTSPQEQRSLSERCSFLHFSALYAILSPTTPKGDAAMSKGIFGGMFDFDGDGRLNAMERGLEFQFFHDVILGREAEETEDEENEEEENV